MKRSKIVELIASYIKDNLDTRYSDVTCERAASEILFLLEEQGLQPPRDVVLLRSGWDEE